MTLPSSASYTLCVKRKLGENSLVTREKLGQHVFGLDSVKEPEWQSYLEGSTAATEKFERPEHGGQPIRGSF